MKIGLIIYGRLETLSGGYLYDRKLVEHLEAQGDEVEIISLPWEGYGRHLLHNFWFALQEQLRQAEFDVLLQDELNHPSLFWLNRKIRREIQYPIISIVHHLRSSEARPGWQNWLYRHVEQRYLTSVDGFIFNSQTTRQVVQSLIGSSQPHIVAPPAGDRFTQVLSPQQIEARSQPPGPLRLLFVGNLIPRKGLHVLLEAVRQLPLSDWQLDVVGDTAVSPRYTQQIQQAIRQHNLANNITLHGSLESVPLSQKMQESHLLAVPSSYEGFGIVYLEGMSFGLPAIGGRGGAAHEIITDGVEGYLVDGGGGAKETAVLRQHIHTLHHNRRQLAQMSHAAQVRFQAHPTWQHSMSQIRQFLQTSQLIVHNPPFTIKMPFTYNFPRYLAAKKTVDDRALNGQVWQALRQNLPKKPRILEVGAGIGTMIERLNEQQFITSVEYTAIDNQPENIAEARRRLATLPAPFQLTLEAIDLFDFIAREQGQQTWDILIAHAFLDLMDIPATLPQLFSLLKPGGLFYFSINFDGATIFEPAIDPALDAHIEQLYHQTMDERLTNGRRSGDSRSGRHLFSYLQKAGATILAAGSSDWVVFAKPDEYPAEGYPADEKYFLQFIVETMHRALAEHPALDQTQFANWVAQRQAQIEAGELIYIAHQLDFLGRKK